MNGQGTVRGTFELNTRPAVRSANNLRDAYRDVDTWARRAGEAGDRIGTAKQRENIRRYRQEIRGLASNMRSAAIAGERLDAVLDRIDRKTARPSIDVRGVDKALAKIELLHKRLNSLGRERSTPRVGLGGGSGGVLRGSTSGRGSFGRGGAMFGTNGINVFGSSLRSAGTAAAIALPIIQTLGGAVAALAGSLGMAGAAAAGISIGGGASLAVGLGSLVAVAKPAISRISEAYKAQTQFNAAQNDQLGISKQNQQAAEATRQSEMRLRDAQRQSRYAQEDLTRARRDARRELVDMALAQDRSRLSEERARISLRRAMSESRRVALDPMASATDRAEARLSVKEARFGVREARIDRGRAVADNRRAQRGGVNALPSVVGATRARQDAVRNVSEAKIGLKQAGAEMAAGASAIATAKQQMDQAFARAPRGTRALLRDIREIRRLWGAADEGTKPGGVDPGVRDAQSNVVRMARGGVGTLKSLTPTLGRIARRSSRAVLREGKGLGRFLTSGRTRGQLTTAGGMFDENLGAARKSSQYIAETMLNITVASRPFLRQAGEFIEKWTRGWAVSTRDVEHTQSKLGKMVDHLKSWGRLTGAAGRLVIDVGTNASGPGKGGVDSMTRNLKRWDDWIRKNPRQVEAFFSRTMDQAKSLADALIGIAKALNRVATQLGPVLKHFTDLVGLMGNLGLLAPGAIAGVMGGVRAFRGRGGGGAGGAGMAGAAGGSGATGGGGGIIPWMMGRGVGAPGVGGGRIRTAFRGGAYGAGRAGAGRIGQLAAGFGASRTAFGRMGGAGGAALRMGGTARMIGMGAGRAALPIAAIMAALDAYGLEGRGGAQRGQAALHTLSLGNVPMPKSGSQISDSIGRWIEGHSSGLSGGDTKRGLQGDIRTLKTLPNRFRGADIDIGSGEERARNIAAANKEFKRMLDERVVMLKDFRRQRNEILDETSRGKSAQYFGEFTEGFTRRSKRQGPVGAMHSTVSGVLGKVGSMRKAGAFDLAQNTLEWARRQARANPKLQGEYERLTMGIEKRLGRMGRRVKVVQGQILDGTRTQWNGIADEMSSAARRGVSETSREFRRLRSLAINSLVLSGFTRSEASGIVSGLNKGGAAATPSKNAVAMGADRMHSIQAQGRKNARAMGDGPGDPGSGRAGTTAGRGSSALMGANAGMAGYASAGASFGTHVSSGLRSGAITSSGNRSLHADGWAIDMAGGDMLGYAKYMASNYGSGLDELIYTPMGFGIKNGERVPLSFWGPQVNADHKDHVHVGDRTPSGPGGGARGTAGAGAGSSAPTVSSRQSKLPGVPGALTTAAGAAYATALNMNMAAAAGTGATAPGSGGGGTNRQIGKRMMLRHGWGADQWPSLDSLWTGESNWDEKAYNSGSGATGIPQSLPGSKMASAGPDWKTNPVTQIKWGLDYIAERYGSPSNAYGQWQARNPHWYAKGGEGLYRGPTMIGVGDGQPSGGYERVTVSRERPSTRGRRRGGGVGDIHLHFDFSGATITSEAHAKALMEKAANHAAKKLLDALEDAVPDSELMS